MREELRKTIQDECIQIALEEQYSTLDVAMRLGKTYISLCVSKNYEKVLVSYPSLAIFNSWKDDSVKFEIDDGHITYTTNLSLHKYDLKEYDLVICDESHTLSQANLEYIASNIPKKMLWLTGTPPILGIKKWYMDRICPIKYSIKLEEVAGTINKDYKIFVHLLNPSSINNIPLSGGRMWNEKARINYFERKYQSSKKFNDMLMLIRAIQQSQTKLDYLIELSKTINRGLFFVETVEQSNMVGFPAYHTKEKDSEENLEMFQDGKINKIVTISQLKQGVTIKNLNDVVILHSYSSNSRATQKLGRCLNYSEDIANIHIIVLKSCRDEIWCKNSLEELNKDKIFYINQK